MEDDSLMLVAANAAEFGRFCRFLLPLWESLLIAQDKGETARLAEQIGLPAPRSLMPANPDELIEVLACISHQVDGECIGCREFAIYFAICSEI
jgi:hypothetical protein